MNQLISEITSQSNDCSIPIDLAKAFDTVSHKLLHKILNNYGIRGTVLKIFENCLKNRHLYLNHFPLFCTILLLSTKFVLGLTLYNRLLVAAE